MNQNLYDNWSLPFIEALYAAGVRNAVISPGSRSTPLTLAALAHSGMTSRVIIDERSAAFYALGQTRVTGLPTVLICTSGTAGGHYLPAIMEASLTHQPLVVITTDRPWEQQDCGSNQTTAQQHLFGRHVKAFYELGEPPCGKEFKYVTVVTRIAVQAVHTSLGPPAGPIHINARFRKPLEPDQWPVPRVPQKTTRSVSSPSRLLLSDDAVASFARQCDDANAGIIVCGPGPMGKMRNTIPHAVEQFAAATGFPVLAEWASGIRRPRAPFVQNTTAYFECIANGMPLPDLVVEIHRPLTTSAYERFIVNHPEIRRVVLSNDRYVDFTANAHAVYTGDISDALARVTERLRPRKITDWSSRFFEFDACCNTVLKNYCEQNHFSEGTLLRSAFRACTNETILFLGNSLIVRDADLFPARVAFDGVIHQRGASGIDGLISGAAGTASACRHPVLLVLGDISALHDLGGFSLLKNLSSPLVVLIVNNDGGQIFSQLPIASTEGLEPELQSGFIVPGTPTFEGVCNMFHVSYHSVQSAVEVRTVIREALQHNDSTVIEARIAPDRAYRNTYLSVVQQAVRTLNQAL